MYDFPQIKLLLAQHRSVEVVQVEFSYNLKIIEMLRDKTSATWSKSMACWYIKRDVFYLKEFFDLFNGIAFIDYSALKTISEVAKPEQKKEQISYAYRKEIDIPRGYKDKLIQKRYSESTVKAYTAYFKDFMHYFRQHELSDLTSEDINVYITGLIERRKISMSQQNQHISAIKFYYEKVLGFDRIVMNLDRPLKVKRLPNTLSKDEVQRIIMQCRNIKHRCILSVIYSAGLRRSELINLRVIDIDSEKGLISIRGAKGRKDRVSLLSISLLKLLREYYRKYHPMHWLFEGKSINTQYSASSIAGVLRDASSRAGIRRKVTPHILRHSFATHLLEQGVDIRYIQELLGHESTRTTEIYTHVSNRDFRNIVNPLDDIFHE